MSSPFKDPFHTPLGSVGDHEPYHDDPTMKPRQIDDVGSSPLNSPFMSMSDTGTPQPNRPSFRSSVGLIPTPGTVSKRHPTYVRHASTTSIGAESRTLAHLVFCIGTCPPAILGRSFGLCVARDLRSCSGGCTRDLK